MLGWWAAAIGLVTLVAATPQPAYATDRVVFATNWKAQAAHGGFYQALADGTYAKYGPGREHPPRRPAGQQPPAAAGRHASTS